VRVLSSQVYRQCHKRKPSGRHAGPSALAAASLCGQHRSKQVAGPNSECMSARESQSFARSSSRLHSSVVHMCYSYMEFVKWRVPKKKKEKGSQDGLCIDKHFTGGLTFGRMRPERIKNRWPDSLTAR
jgi:hypothetical protein